MTRLGIVVIVRSKNIAGHYRCEGTAVLFLVGAIHDVNQTFCVAVAEIRGVRRTVMDLHVSRLSKNYYLHFGHYFKVLP